MDEPTIRKYWPSSRKATADTGRLGGRRRRGLGEPAGELHSRGDCGPAGNIGIATARTRIRMMPIEHSVTSSNRLRPSKLRLFVTRLVAASTPSSPHRVANRDPRADQQQGRLDRGLDLVPRRLAGALADPELEGQLCRRRSRRTGLSAVCPARTRPVVLRSPPGWHAAGEQARRRVTNRPEEEKVNTSMNVQRQQRRRRPWPASQRAFSGAPHPRFQLQRSTSPADRGARPNRNAATRDDHCAYRGHASAKAGGPRVDGARRPWL